MEQGSEFSADWRYVTSASLLIRNIQDGYLAPYGLGFSSRASDGIHSQAGFRIPLVRGSQIGYQAGKFIEPMSEIGFPVSVVFQDEFRWESSIESTNKEIGYIRHTFPMIKGSFKVGFTNALYMEKFRKWIDDTELRPFSYAMDGCFIEPSLEAANERNLLTPDIESDSSVVPEPVLKLFESEERWQCAVEMVLGVAKTLEQIEFAATLMSGDPGTGSNSSSSVRALGSLFLTNEGKNSSFVDVFCHLLLDIPAPLRFGPLTLFEKSDLIEKTLKQLGPSNAEKSFFEDLLHHVREDVGLSQIALNGISPELQGLVIFLSNNSSLAEVLKLVPESFPDLDPLAISVCAFFVGLRWRRTRFPSTLYFPALRSAHVRQISSVPLRPEENYIRQAIEVSRSGTGLMIAGEFFSPPTEMYVWNLPTNSRILLKLDKSIKTMSSVDWIAAKDPKDFKTAKETSVFRPKKGYEVEVVNSIHFALAKSVFRITLFLNRDLERYLEERTCIEIKCVGEIYLHTPQGLEKVKNPVISIIDFVRHNKNKNAKTRLIAEIRNGLQRSKIGLDSR